MNGCVECDGTGLHQPEDARPRQGLGDGPPHERVPNLSQAPAKPIINEMGSIVLILDSRRILPQAPGGKVS